MLSQIVLLLGGHAEIAYFGGESGGIGRFNEREAVSQCDPIAERDGIRTNYENVNQSDE